MGLFELFLIAVGLSMDAFAVSVCEGLSMRKATINRALVYGLYFGGFQAAMPLIGYFLGSRFADRIQTFDHWIAFVLLAIIGIKMIIDSFKKDDLPQGTTSVLVDVSLKPSKMLPLALATSIDALAVGISFSFLKVNIIPAVSFIGIITLIFSITGIMIGGIFGAKFKSRAELAGGVILVGMGLKILLEHLGIFA